MKRQVLHWRRGLPWFLLGIASLVLGNGCVHRRLTIRSNPPGATVYVDKREIGRTPVSTPFTYYATREIQLVRDGYEVVTQKEKIRPPWYQIPPLDFLSENLWPGEIRDERVVDFQLIPQEMVDPNQVAERGQALREQAGGSGGTGIPIVAPPPSPSGQSSGVQPFLRP